MKTVCEPRALMDTLPLPETSSHEEVRTLKAEGKWILATQLPTSCEELATHLQTCLNFISKSQSPNATKDPEFDGVETYDSEDPVMKGLTDTQFLNYINPEKTMDVSVELQGWDIPNASIKVIFSKWHPNKVITTKISPAQPWRLTQIQNCVYYLKNALETLNEQFYSTDTGSRKFRTDLTYETVFETFNIIFSLIKQAKDQLLLPIRITFPKNTHTASMFNPPLPPEMLADYKIKNKMLVVTCAIMHPINKPTSKQSNSESAKENGSNKKTFYSKRHNQYYEIVDQVSVEIRVRKIDTIYLFIQECWEICSDLKEKLLLVGNHC